MASEIVDADVGFGLDDAGAELSATTPVDENLAQQIGSEVDCRTFVERAAQFFPWRPGLRKRPEVGSEDSTHPTLFYHCSFLSFILQSLSEAD
jgi:hypothetical protein